MTCTKYNYYELKFSFPRYKIKTGKEITFLYNLTWRCRYQTESEVLF